MNTPDADQTTSPTPKPVIYQMLPRLFANRCPDPVPGGTMERGMMTTVLHRLAGEPDTAFAQVFTDVRYPRGNNELFSEKFLGFLKSSGFIR